MVLPSGKTVLATGVFDLLHLGHLRFLEESKRKGGPRSRLVVIVAADKTVFRRKGKAPVIPGGQRRELVAALRVVDRAILRAAVTRLIRKQGLPIRVIRIRRFGPIGFNSSSKLKNRVAKALSVA